MADHSADIQSNVELTAAARALAGNLAKTPADLLLGSQGACPEYKAGRVPPLTDNEILSAEEIPDWME